MPTFVKGNMWDVFGNTDLFLITTNPIIRSDGAVVMGRGIAKQAKERFPTLPYDFGRLLALADTGYREPFPVSVIGKYDNQAVGYFMVKDHWKAPASWGIIEEGVFHLLRMSPDYSRIDLNFPGIGNGKLKREDVLPLLEPLPDSVHIWEFE